MQRLNTLHLKLLAVCLMLCDHVAWMFLPRDLILYWILRAMGRLSAPLFWHCFTVGFRYTSSKFRYLTRLGIFAAVMALGNLALHFFSEGRIPFSPRSPNIFLTMLAMGAILWLCEQVLEKENATWKRICSGVAAILLTIPVLLWCEYGSYALLWFPILYFVRSDLWASLALTASTLLLILWQQNWLYLCMLLVIPLLLFCGEDKPKRSGKWFFYLFYPIHLWLMALVYWCLITWF